jgi:arylsulfatase A
MVPHLEAGADPDYFDSNGAFRGYKRDLYEGGIRVPMIAVWDGKITPKTETTTLQLFGMYSLHWLKLQV